MVFGVPFYHYISHTYAILLGKKTAFLPQSFYLKVIVRISRAYSSSRYLFTRLVLWYLLPRLFRLKLIRQLINIILQ